MVSFLRVVYGQTGCELSGGDVELGTGAAWTLAFFVSNVLQ